LFIKKFVLILVCSLIFLNAYGEINAVRIDGKNNAYRHNNKGLIYLEDKYYYGAIKEFQIAIDLSPSSQASAIFYTNLGNTYEKIGHLELAKPCYEKAISLNVLCFDYYLKLSEIYKKLGLVDEKLNEYTQKNNSPLNKILIVLLYIQKGEVTTGVTMLDDFCSNEPNLMITQGIKNYLNDFVKEKL